MSRSNAYLQAGNDCGRQVSVGGRGCANEVWAWLNTDNATHSDCGMRVRAEVTGPGLSSRERRLKSVGDQRISVFTVELPDQSDEFCQVRIVRHGYQMRQLVEIGGVLCGLKAAQEAAAGDTAQAIKTIRGAAKILAELEEEEARRVPNVELPGGVTLAHALACVEVCRRLATHKTKRQN